MTAQSFLKFLNKKIQSGDAINPNEIRSDLATEYQLASTDEDRSLLLETLFAMNGFVERNISNPPELKVFRESAHKFYLALLVGETLVDELVDLELLRSVTRREVNAGRMSADDEFNKLALAGYPPAEGLEVPTPPIERTETGIFGRLFNRKKF